MRFFHNVFTLEELKKAYRKLALVHHPDRGGNEKDFIALKDEFDKLFKRLKHQGPRKEQHQEEQQQEEQNATYATYEDLEKFKEIIDQLINLDIEIEIIGTWLWLTGDTRAHKELLKTLGLKWGPKKKAWYWHEGEYKRHHKQDLSLDDIRKMHNSKKYKTNKKPSLTE